MNEKYKQYYYTKNDKNLINQQIPTENDLRKFEEWKILKRKELLFSCMASLIFSCIMIIVSIALESKVIGIILLMLSGLLIFSSVKKYITSKKWKPEYCDYGKIIDKFITYDGKNNKEDDYYVIILVNQNELKVKIKKNEYQNLELNDEVIIYAIQSEKEVFISKK